VPALRDDFVRTLDSGEHVEVFQPSRVFVRLALGLGFEL
jgi:hypothetical protein